LQNTKDYYEANKEKIKANYDANKDKIIETSKDYYEVNKEIIKEKRKKIFECECGCICLKIVKVRHFKSNKHLSFINSS
jgi:hypothetical protein